MNCAGFKKVSIAVLTFNSEKTIRKCLTAIKNLHYPSDCLEIIILDNGSTDKTIEIITEMGFRPPFFPDLNLSQLRNKTTELSTGEIIGYIDSDCIVSPDWVDKCVRWFDDPSVGIVGNEYLLPDSASYFEKNWYGKSNFGIKENELIPAGNMAVSKEKFIQVGGFDSKLITGEDAQLIQAFQAAGYKTISDCQIKCVHLGNAKNLIEYYRKEIWYGLGMLGTVKPNQFDKPFFISNLYFGLMLIFTVGVCFTMTNSDSAVSLLVFSAAGLIGIPLLAAIERIYIKKRTGNFYYVSIVFIVFLLARVHSLIYIYGLKKYGRK